MSDDKDESRTTWFTVGEKNRRFTGYARQGGGRLLLAALEIELETGLARVQSTRERFVVAVDADQGPWPSAEMQEGVTQPSGAREARERSPD